MSLYWHLKLEKIYIYLDFLSFSHVTIKFTQEELRETLWPWLSSRIDSIWADVVKLWGLFSFFLQIGGELGHGNTCSCHSVNRVTQQQKHLWGYTSKRVSMDYSLMCDQDWSIGGQLLSVCQRRVWGLQFDQLQLFWGTELLGAEPFCLCEYSFKNGKLKEQTLKGLVPASCF